MRRLRTHILSKTHRHKLVALTGDRHSGNKSEKLYPEKSHSGRKKYSGKSSRINWKKKLTDIVLLNLLTAITLLAGWKIFSLNWGMFNPFKQALKDFEFTDFYYSKLLTDGYASKDIVVVNIDTLGRQRIAQLLIKLNESEPAVIGLDVEFKGNKDRISDSLLKEVFLKTKNLVGVNRLKGDELNHEDNVPEFNIQRAGFANLFGDKNYESVIRDFKVMHFEKERFVRSFAAEIAILYNPSVETYLETLGSERHKIAYLPQQAFRTFQGKELLQKQNAKKLLKGKIVLLGYTGGIPVPGNTFLLEDKHFTPLNSKMAGRSLPDTYGVYIHASILQSLLDRTAIRYANNTLEKSISILLNFFIAALILFYYASKPKWFHIMAKTIQMGIGLSFLLLSLFIMLKWKILLDFTFLFLLIILTSDLVYFYDLLTKFLRKWNIFNSSIPELPKH